MFVLANKKKIGYSFGAWTFYATKHKGQDYEANYVNLYAPCDSYASTFTDLGGGNWIQFSNGNTLIQCAHLSKIIKTGQVKEGDLVAVTGNTGKFTTGPHLHLQIKKDGTLIDPEVFWEGEDMAGMDDRIKEIQGIWKRLDKLESGMNDRMKETKGIWQDITNIKTTQKEILGKLDELVGTKTIIDKIKEILRG